MIRPATTSDLPRLYELVRQMHAASEFAKRGIALNPPLVRRFLMDGVRRHGGNGVGSTLLNVVEKAGQVEAFMLGLFQPIYGVCVGLEAQDFWLFATKRAPKLSAGLLIDGYVEWASANPKVEDIMLSWTDVVGVDPAKIARLYYRKGFRRVGEIWKRGAR